MHIDKGELFTTKMLELYGRYEDSLTEIIKNRDQYLNTEDPAYEPYVRIINTYDMSKQINGTDPDISEALHATCLWYIFKYISGDDEDPIMFLDDQEPDAKGAQRAPKLNLNKLALFLIRKYCIVSFNDYIHCYIDDKYYEMPMKNGRLYKDLVKLLMTIGYSDHTKIKEIISDVIFRVNNLCAKYKEYPFNKKAKFLIPVKNGVIVRRKLNLLLTQSPAWGFTYCLSVNYDPKSDTKVINKFLKDIVDNDSDIELLLQIPAQALLQDTGYQQAYLLTGGGANGKSTFINVTKELIGKSNIVALSLQDIVENKFSSAELQGKLLNLYPDLPNSSVKTTGKFKAVTGSDTITAEKKFGQPFQLENKAVFAFSANSLPAVEDSSYAFWRRWAIIEFPHVFKVDPEFIKKLTTPENLSGFLNLIVDKMDRIETHGLTRSDKVEDAMDTWKKRSNSAYAYITDMLVRSPNDWINKETIYNLYINYCQENDYTALSKPKFTIELEQAGGIVGQTTEAQNRVRIIRGFKLKKKILPEMKIKEEAALVF